MSLDIRCPNCGEPATAAEDALYRAAECNACHARFFVKDAVVKQESPVAAPPRTGMGAKQRLVVSVCLAIPAAVVVLLALRSGTTSPASGTPAANDNALVEERRERIAAQRENDLRIARDRQEAEQRSRMQAAQKKALDDVRDSLISPSSAQFSDVFVQYIRSRDVYSVRGTVDSQNVYGAMLRSRFERYLRYSASGWEDITQSLSYEQHMDLLNASGKEMDDLLESVRRHGN
jgi:hypothetical protein